MKAAVLHARDDLSYEEMPDPHAGPDELVVRVRAVGICGSDVPRVLGNGAHYFPIVLGHEFAGEVAECGPGVEGFSTGERVAGAPLLPCFACEDCQRGDYALCRRYSFIGSRRDGAFAEYVALPARNAVKIGNTPFDQGALTEPSTVALHGLLHARPSAGARVAVIGCGTIGLFAGLWARLLGARNVTAFDIDGGRTALARELCADETFLSSDADCAAAAKEHGAFDCVIDAVGAEATLRLALELAGNHASICLIGTPTRETRLSVRDMETLNRKELWLTGSWMSYSAPFPGREWEWTAKRFADGSLPFDARMIGGRFPLAEATKAFDLYRTPGAAQGRILLIP